MGIVISQPPVATTQIINTGVPATAQPVTTPTPAQQLQERLAAAGSPPAGSSPSAGAPSARQPIARTIPGLPPFKSIEKALLPLSGQHIHQFRGKVRKTQDGGNEPIIPKNGITQVITVDPNSGETPTIHMAAGYACSLTVVDGAGQPWPIVTAVIGSGKRFTAQGIDKNALEPTIVVSDLLPHAQSNLLLTLQGLNTPIPVQLVSGGPLENGKETVAYRVILRVRGMVPGGLPPSFSPSPNHGTTAALLQTLYGTMPAAAKTLRVKNAPAYSYTRAWRMNGDLWIRSHGRLLAPAWIATEASANGVHAYVLPQTHAVLLRFNGINQTLEVR
ncbi:DotH/IcmK family type IV secretion protein [Acidithiobacillus sp.]|uniref:DotH/IcmK family type IV secretion protein n=1 Tax=Acidithiobacillus sp. TaxID=1872118 RepID=UPI00230FCE27|nr:DotH/IcmK family type IV secretion protein [Acidithiobacillus sp.]MDA8247156.1 hypothetical protein [Acidithiobacillus sp.]